MSAINLPVALATIAETPQLNYSSNKACIYPVIKAKEPYRDPFTGFLHYPLQQREYQMPIISGSSSLSSSSGGSGGYSSYSIAPIGNGYTSSSERWHPPADDESYHIPIKPKKKHPIFTVEIIEEDQWLS